MSKKSRVDVICEAYSMLSYYAERGQWTKSLSHTVTKNIKKLTDIELMEMVSRKHNLFEFVPNPSRELSLFACKCVPYLIQMCHFDDDFLLTLLTSSDSGHRVINFIRDKDLKRVKMSRLSDDVQILAVTQSPECISYIADPCDQAKVIAALSTAR